MTESLKMLRAHAYTAM